MTAVFVRKSCGSTYSYVVNIPFERMLYALTGMVWQQ